MPDQQDAISVQGLVKYFEAINPAVDELSFTVRKGEIYGLLGPNGAGKSTTLKCMAGILNFDEGSITVCGYDPMKNPEMVKTITGYVPEESNLYKSMTPLDLLDFIASVRRMNSREAGLRAHGLLTILDAKKYGRKRIGTLSKGNQQKVLIAAALLHDPKVLLLDEPLTGLDVITRHIVKEILSIMAKDGVSIILSTHITDEAAYLCHRIGIINEGKMVAEGTLKELQEQIGTDEKSLDDIFLKLSGSEDIVKTAIDAFLHLKNHDDK
ncbi:MAG TPA: ABC transporter ATP-binding protein [Candidatus Lokiarchaeia archaeon]|nr:ABC transporter ATP-binding protein [Candidatus Lokiarchaeia archaeon]